VTLMRLGAVDYLNARPLVYGLELRSDLFSLRFDPPSKCAALLHEGSIDVGMIPTIEYLRGPSYCIVPGMAIASDGPVESVAVYSRVPIDQVRTLAADTSSRTSAGLLQVLCYERFGIDPVFRPMAPDPAAMLAACDAALIIGDPALFLDHEAAGLQKIDLGAEWTAMTGLPFVWAFWAGRPGALTRAGVAALAHARDQGVEASDELAAAYCGPGRAERGRAYLRENIQYQLGEREEAGLRAYYELAVEHGVAPATRAPLYYHRDD
jgi:chorismate dehydratase